MAHVTPDEVGIRYGRLVVINRAENYTTPSNGG